MRPSKYILVDGEPCPAELMEWARWFETADRTVARTERDGVTVSTVFLSIDHNFSPKGPSILWETMVFGGPLDGEEQRYTSAEAAKHGHEQMVALAMGQGR